MTSSADFRAGPKQSLLCSEIASLSKTRQKKFLLLKYGVVSVVISHRNKLVQLLTSYFMVNNLTFYLLIFGMHISYVSFLKNVFFLCEKYRWVLGILC